MPKYSDNELQNKSVEELESIKNQLQQSKGRTKPVPSQPRLTDIEPYSLETDITQIIDPSLGSWFIHINGAPLTKRFIQLKNENKQESI